MHAMQDSDHISPPVICSAHRRVFGVEIPLHCLEAMADAEDMKSYAIATTTWLELHRVSYPGEHDNILE